MLDSISKYCDLIKKFNPVLNLVSPKDISLLESRHVSEAEESFRIFMTIYSGPPDYSIFDLGSGNGIPGLVWSILNPSIPHTLVEIDLRKSEFLKHCIRELKLNNVSVLNTDFSKVAYPNNTIFIARAFMNLNKLLDNKSPLRNKMAFLLKGSTWNNELEGIEDLILNAHSYSLKDGTKRSLVIYNPNSQN